MKSIMAILLLVLLLATNALASDREKATYVGGGRYGGVGEFVKSIMAILLLVLLLATNAFASDREKAT